MSRKKKIAKKVRRRPTHAQDRPTDRQTDSSRANGGRDGELGERRATAVMERGGGCPARWVVRQQRINMTATTALRAAGGQPGARR